MVPHGEVLRIATQAPKLTPIPIDRDFVAAMLRRATNPKWWQAERQRIRGEAFAEERTRHAQRIEDERKGARREYEALLANVREFEKASGLEIVHGWQHERIGKAVQFLLDTVMPGRVKPDSVGETAARLRIIAGQLDELNAALADFAKVPPPSTSGGR